jgi:hypothetical protein
MNRSKDKFQEVTIMFLLVEIALTVAAWRKGWNGWALLPILGTLFIGFIIGAAAALSGGSIESVYPVSILADVACIGVLIALNKRTPRSATPTEMAEAKVITNIPGNWR